MLSKGLESCKMMKLSSQALDAIISYAEIGKYTMDGQSVFKQRCKANMVVLVLSGALKEGTRVIEAGNFVGESALLKSEVEWSFRKQTLSVKSLATVAGFSVANIHELISTNVKVGLTLYITIARSLLLRYTTAGKSVAKGYFFDLDHVIAFADKGEVLLNAVAESERRGKKKN